MHFENWLEEYHVLKAPTCIEVGRACSFKLSDLLFYKFVYMCIECMYVACPSKKCQALSLVGTVSCRSTPDLRVLGPHAIS